MLEMMAVVRVLFALGALVAAAETVASALWVPVYFRYGVRVYTRRVTVRMLGTAPDLMDFVSCSTTGLCFCRLSSEEIAFREPLITFTRVPLMHGWMNYDGSRLQVSGLISWTIVFIGILVSVIGTMFVLLAPVYAILMFVTFGDSIAWLYDVQRQRFDDLVVEVTARFRPPANERLEQTT